MPNQPTVSAKNVTGNSGVFTDLMRRLMQVPHAEVKAKLDAEKTAKRTSKASASRVPVSAPKRAT